jgi:hypothetical protein
MVLVGLEAGGRAPTASDLAVGDVQVLHGVDAVGRVDQAAVLDM